MKGTSHRSRTVEKLSNGYVVHDQHYQDGMCLKDNRYFTEKPPPETESRDLTTIISGKPAEEPRGGSSLAAAMVHGLGKGY